MKKQVISLLLTLMLLLGLLPAGALAAGDCITTVQPEGLSTTAGGLVTVPLADYFTDEAGHELSFTLSDPTQESSTLKIADGALSFTTPTPGTYTVPVTAVCADGAQAELRFVITVMPGDAGLQVQYNYEQTPADSVTVYVTISSDGVPIKGKDDDETILSHVEVTVPYFDLAQYGLEAYYRYQTAPEGGPYINRMLIERPTALHLFIYMLQRYYLGLPESLCGINGGTGIGYGGISSNPLLQSGMYGVKGYGVLDMFGDPNRYGGESYVDRAQALRITGNATSLYMKEFWGHSENLMYYRNHAYPLMSPGWGSTADYILLSDGDTIDLAMFTDYDFFNRGSFATFVDRDTRLNDGGSNGSHTDINHRPSAAFTARVGEPTVISAVRFGTQSVANGGVDDFLPIAEDAYAKDLQTHLYDEHWQEIETIEPDMVEDYGAPLACVWQDDGEGHYTLTFNEPGTYYLLGMDSKGGTKTACIAPATAKIVVTGTAAHRGDVNADGQITAQDVQVLRNYLKGKAELSQSQLLAADVNNDGQITAQDVQVLRNYLKGKTTL